MAAEGLARAPRIARMDILEHLAAELLDILKRHSLSVDEPLRVHRAHRDGTRHAEGDAHTLERLFVRAQAGVDGGAKRRDVHRVSHGILDIVPECPVIGRLGDENRRLNLAVLDAQIHRSRPDIKIPDRHPAYTVFARDIHDGLPRVERGGGVGGGHAVAGVAADGSGVADLRAAHHVHGLAEDVDIPLDDRVVRDVRKARQAPDADVLLFVDRDAAHLIAALDGDERLSGALALAHLDEHVRAARDDLRLGP